MFIKFLQWIFKKDWEEFREEMERQERRRSFDYARENKEQQDIIQLLLNRLGGEVFLTDLEIISMDKKEQIICQEGIAKEKGLKIYLQKPC